MVRGLQHDSTRRRELGATCVPADHEPCNFPGERAQALGGDRGLIRAVMPEAPVAQELAVAIDKGRLLVDGSLRP